MNRTWEQRVTALEHDGLTRSDAQAVVDAEDHKAETSLLAYVRRDGRKPTWEEGQCFYCGKLTKVKEVKAANWVGFDHVSACRTHLKGTDGKIHPTH